MKIGDQVRIEPALVDFIPLKHLHPGVRGEDLLLQHGVSFNEGEVGRITDAWEHWVKVEVPGGTGWIHRDWVKVVRNEVPDS